MPTINFDANNPGIVNNGRVTVNNIGYGNMLQFAGGSYCLVSITGTDATIRMLTFNGYDSGVSFTVDGGSVQTLDFTGTVDGGSHTFTLFTGLSDVPHVVKFYPSASTVGSFWYSNLLQVTGASPALAVPANYNNTNQFPIGTTSGIKGDNEVSAFSGYDHFFTSQIRFKAKTSRIRLWHGASENPVRFDHPITLYVDRNPEPIAQLPPLPYTPFDWLTFEGLDDTAEHEYWISATGDAYSIMLSDDGVLNTTAMPDLDMAYFNGDSTTAGLTTYLTQNWVQTYCLLAGLRWVNAAASGGTLPGQGVSPSIQPTAVSPAPVEAWYIFGINDSELIADGISETYTDWENAMASIQSYVHTNLPSCKLIFAGLPLDTPSVTVNGQFSALNAHTIAKVAALADPNCTYMPADTQGHINWFNDILLSNDGQHYDRVSQRAYGYVMRDYMHPAPAADGTTKYKVYGRQAHPRNFPVQPVAWSGIQVPLTLHSPDKDATGTTVTPHTSGTGRFTSATIDLKGTVPSSRIALHYIPSVADENTTVTITFTNNNGLLDPDPVSFEVVPGHGALIDDQDPTGVTYTGSWADFATGFSSLLSKTSSTSGATASFHFTNLVAGQYKVKYTWPGYASFAGVTWQVLDSNGTTVLDSGSFVQTANPDGTGGTIYDGTAWVPFQLLSTVTIAGTSLTLKLTNPPGNTSVADCAWVERATPITISFPFRPEHIHGLRCLEARTQDHLPDQYLANRLFDRGSLGYLCSLIQGNSAIFPTDTTGEGNTAGSCVLCHSSVAEFNGQAAFEFINATVNGVGFNASKGISLAAYLEAISWTKGTVVVVFRKTGTASPNETLWTKTKASGGKLGRNGSTADSWGGAMPDATGSQSKYLTLADDGSAHMLYMTSDGTTFTVDDGAGNSQSNTVALSSNTDSIGFGDDGAGGVFTGQMAAAFWIPRQLTNAEKISLVSYLHSTYGAMGFQASGGPFPFHTDSELCGGFADMGV